VNTAITQLDLDRPSWRTDLANRYYTTDNGDELLFSSEERAYLKQLSDEGIVFKVAVNPDNSPYSYFVDGQAAGVLPTVFAEIAEKTGIDYEIMPTTTRAEYEDAISSRQADIIIDATCSLYEAEESGYKLDDSYASLTLSQLTRRNRSGDIATVCLPADIARAIGVTEGKPSGGSITYSIVDSTQACVDGVLAGTYDAAYLYTYTARQYMNDDERNSLTMFLLPDYSVPMALAVSAQLDTRLTTILDKASHSVSQRASDILLAQGEETAEGPISFIGLLYDHPVGVIGVVALLGTLLLLVLVLFFRAHAAKLERNRRVELERSEQALSGALEKARAANDAKSTFLSNMSHDMRTPLNGILGFSELALKTDDTAARQAYLEKIESSGKLMLGLVNDTLDLSKIESGKMTLEPEDADARELFDGIVDSVRVSADEKHITFIADIANADFGIVHVDRLRMQQVFLNLLSNAIKYTPDGGTVWFTVRHLDQPIDGCNYLSTVRDNGIGMGAEFLPHVFEAFSQEHAKESRNVTGTGLGLSIVSKIVELMGGRISVESAKGEGTTFDVYLPVEIVDSAARAADADRLPQVDLTGKHILLCEDNRLNAEISETLLAERGLSVEKAWDGKECVEKFETSPVGAYDAILMDLRMPIMDGYAAAQAIRALERPDAATVPIIAMSADAYTDDVRHCLDVGMNSHVSKPVDPERLFAELARLCG